MLKRLCILTGDHNIYSTPHIKRDMEIYNISVLSENEIRECEGVVEMIKELPKGINCFNEDELLEILAYISST